MKNKKPVFKCKCGKILEVAYEPKWEAVFYNCFRCDPQHQRAPDEIRRAKEEKMALLFFPS